MFNIAEAYPRLGKIERTVPLWQYDEGQIIHINGIELPAAYMAEFSNTTRGDAEQYIQQTDEITVPAQYLQSGQPVYIWLVIEDSESRTTMYEIVSPVALRSRPHGELIPEERTPFDAALAALNSGVERVERIADAIPDTINDALALKAAASALTALTSRVAALENMANHLSGSEQGAPGRDGAVQTLGDAEFAFHIDENGHLIMDYGGNTPPPFEIDSRGHLIYNFSGQSGGGGDTPTPSPAAGIFGSAVFGTAVFA